jgi:Ca-activated chloride channel family protein
MNAKRQTELERDLRFEVPPPPADLRPRLVAGIPAELPTLPPPTRSAGGDADVLTDAAWWRFRGPTTLRLAAALAVVAVGTAVAWRVARETAPPAPAAAVGPPTAQTEELKPPRILRESASADMPLAGPPSPPTALAAAKPDAAVAETARVAPAPFDELVAAAEDKVLDRRVAQPSLPSGSRSTPVEARRERQEVGRDGELAETITVTGEAAPMTMSASSSTTRAAGVEGGVSGGFPGGVYGGAVGGVRAEEPVPAAPVPVAPASAPPASPAPASSSMVPAPQYPVPPPLAKAAAATAPPSTGGTAEPNEQAFGDMFFRPTDANPFVDAEEDRQSTFGLDVDTGSYTLARSYLDRGALPPREGIRVEEFVNAFDYGDAAPNSDDFALYAEGAPSPYAPGEQLRLLRFAIRAQDLDPALRKPLVLTFVVDISGSMAQENRLGLVRQALGLLLGQLRPGDHVGLVIYGSYARVLQTPTDDLGRVRQAIEQLRPEGATNAEDGLRQAYDVAGSAYRQDAVNRVILCADGVANVGATGPESILARIGQEARRGIELTTVGFGMGNYNDALMEQLADQGNGRYAYVDTLAEARRLFVDDIAGTLVSIAGDAKAQVTFDPRVVERWRLLGYENRDVADHRFRDDTVDAGEIGYGHTVTALYEVKLRPNVRRTDRLALLELRYKQVATGKVKELSKGLWVGELANRWSVASSRLRLAGSVAEFAELLRGSYWARGGSFTQVSTELATLPKLPAGEERRRELEGLVESASRLSAVSPAPAGVEQR